MLLKTTSQDALFLEMYPSFQLVMFLLNPIPHHALSSTFTFTSLFLLGVHLLQDLQEANVKIIETVRSN